MVDRRFMRSVKPHTGAQILLLVALLWLVLRPTAYLFYGAIRTDSPGTPGAGYSLTSLGEAFGSLVGKGDLALPLRNSLIVSSVSTVLALAMGVALAWLVQRTNVRARRFIQVSLIIPIFYSMFVSLIGFSLLGSPRSGYVNVLWRNFTGGDESTSLIDIYTVKGIVIVMTLHYLPYIVLIMSGPMKAMDAALEDAAAIAGSSKWQTTRRVTLPLLIPSIAAAGLFIFVLAMENFAIPGFLATRIKFPVLAYSIYTRVVGLNPDLPLAAAASTVLLVIAIVLLVLYRHFTKTASRYVTVSARGYRPATIDLGRWRPVYFVASLLFVLATTYLPMGAVVLRSLMEVRGTDIDLATLGSSNYSDLFHRAYFVEGLRNSAVLSVGVAVAVVALGLVVGRWKARQRPTLVVTALDYAVSVPLALPGIVVGLAFLWAYVGTSLYLSLGLMGLALFARFGAVGVQTVTSGILQIDRALEEASSVAGASGSTTMRRITMPLIRPVLASAWLVVFLMVARELATSIMLYGQGSRTLPILTWNLLVDAQYGSASALACLQVISIVCIVLVFRLLMRIDITSLKAR